MPHDHHKMMVMDFKKRFIISTILTIPILLLSSMIQIATYRKMLENLFWATSYNVIAIPLAAGVLSSYGVII